MKKTKYSIYLASIFVILRFSFASASSVPDSNLNRILKDGRPWVIYYWVNGLMDHDGITKDIQKLEAAGVGGVFIADVNLGIPDDGPAFNSPEWRKLLAHAATEAKEKGLVVALQPAAGWSGMGGPWVPVEDSIKELTWSVTPVQGAGERKTISLPEPKKNSNHYRDIAVLAIPGPGSENVADRVKLLPSSTLSAKNFEILRDQSLDKDVNLARETTIDIELPRTLVPGALRFRLPRLSFDRAGDLPVDLSTSTDGKRWVPLKTCDLRWNFGAPEVRDKPIQNSITVTLPPKTGRFLRLKTRFKAPAPVAEIEFLAGAHIDRREAKSALIMDRKHDSGFDEIHNPTDTQAAGLAIPKQSVVNLSGLMDAAGRLTWDVPVGDWRILRFGYTTTGRKKGVTRAGGQGWLVDILDPAALVRHLESYYGTLIAEGGPLDGGRLQILHSDSWEEFHANWTKGFSEQFANLRGYDPICFLPVIAGEAIVDSTEVSERFLWDFRRTLADLVVTNYYGTLHQWGKDRGLVMHSDHAGRQQWLTDPVRYQTATDIPIGEFWLFENSLRPDVKMAASAAHITGNNLASGEAFTDTGINDGWRTCPSRLKSIGDRAFCEGINLFNLHTYTAQPAHMPPPGVTLGKWGTILSRNRLWWEDFASEWHGYVQRCSELLREGRFSGDVLLIASDGAPSETGRSEDFPVPPGHGFDVGASELLEKATVENGEVVLPSGMRYRLVSFLGAEQRPTTLRQVKRLVEAGAAVHGPRPVRAPGLENYPASDVEVAALAGELWPDAGKTQRELGAGRLFTEMPISEVLKTIDLTPQFQADKSGLRFIRRETDRGPLYFVANPEADAIETTCRFRVSGRVPVLYDPISKQDHPVPFYTEDSGGDVTIPLRFDALDSVFIRFVPDKSIPPVAAILRDGVPFDYFHPVATQGKSGPLSISAAGKDWRFARTDDAEYQVTMADANSLSVKTKIASRLIHGPWNLSFSSPIGDEPEPVAGAQLGDWLESADESVKFFSGTATYRTSFASEGRRTVLDLGKVYDHAMVRINGELAGKLWKPPFRLDISRYVHQGTNTLEIEITNDWRNRMIGEERFPSDLRYAEDGTLLSNPLPVWALDPGVKRPEPRRRTFTTFQHINQSSPLSPSGLVGPVQIEETLADTPAR